MDTFYVIAILFLAALTLSAPLDNGADLTSPFEQNPLRKNDLAQTPYDLTPISEEDIHHHLAKRETSAASEASDGSDDGETLDSAADTVYIPYVRYRQYFGQRRRVYVNRRRSGNNYPGALVGYADDRDRFPTVA